MNERKGRVLEALLETVEFAVLSYAMSGAAFALRRDPLWILFMVVEIRLLQKYWAAEVPSVLGMPLSRRAPT